MPIIPGIIKVYNFVEIHIMHECWVDYTSRQKHKLAVFVLIIQQTCINQSPLGDGLLPAQYRFTTKIIQV